MAARNPLFLRLQIFFRQCLYFSNDWTESVHVRHISLIPSLKPIAYFLPFFTPFWLFFILTVNVWSAEKALYLEGTDRKEGGTGILMNDVPGI